MGVEWTGRPAGPARAPPTGSASAPGLGPRGRGSSPGRASQPRLPPSPASMAVPDASPNISYLQPKEKIDWVFYLSPLRAARAPRTHAFPASWQGSKPRRRTGLPAV